MDEKQNQKSGRESTPAQEERVPLEEVDFELFEEKKKDDGRAVSADYRSAYRKKGNAKAKAKEKKPPMDQFNSTLNAAANATMQAVRETAKKVAAPPPAEPEEQAAPEMDDFLPEGEENEDDVLLTKNTSEEAEETEEPEETLGPEPVPPAGRRRRGRYRYGIGTGALVVLLAFIGVAAIVVTLGRELYRIATDDSKLRAYDTFLSAIVMQDPEPFESVADADEEMIMKAALWRAVTLNGAEYSTYDESGRTLVPLGDVVDACHELFGPDCELQPSNPKNETFFEYDAEANVFHVSPFSSQSSFAPYTVSSKRSGSTVVLRVGYVAASDEWRGDSSSQVERPTPVKYMEYVLQTDVGGKNAYVTAIRDADKD